MVFIRIIFLLEIIILSKVLPIYASTVTGHTSCRIMFYNTENFFDTKNDSLTNDEEFLPNGKKHWTQKRYNEKLRHVFQVIAAVGGIAPPAVVGFSEIENRSVLEDLLHKTPLQKYPYKIIHQDSPDLRGIDVGLIYRSDKMKCLSYHFFRINFPGHPYKKTRDILYFKALIHGDTLHIFVNHWPSRWGGRKRSEPGRMFVASVLKSKTDSILSGNSCARIIIMGDFNDDPTNASLQEVLAAHTSTETLQCDHLYDLSSMLQKSCHCGSLKFGAEWDMFDQFVVSGKMLTDTVGLHTTTKSVRVGNFHFLLIPDTRYGGYKPFRTYRGPVYIGGFSDHLPVYLDLFW